MLINTANLDLVFSGFSTVYRDSYDKAPAHADKIAMTMPSSARDETYGWIGQFPNLREWIGPRHVQNLAASTFTIINRKFETTIGIKREDISDDQLGIFKPMVAEMGIAAKQHPDRLVFELLASGFAANCYDGQFYFDTDHPVIDVSGATVNVSNTGGGADTAWFLLDTSRSVKPIIWQKREDYDFQTVQRPDDPYVFMHDEYLYGVRARVNAGFGFWQFAYGSKQALTPANYAAARAAMMSFKADGGHALGIAPNTLVVPPSLEQAALEVVNTEYGTGGISNPRHRSHPMWKPWGSTSQSPSCYSSAARNSMSPRTPRAGRSWKPLVRPERAKALGAITHRLQPRVPIANRWLAACLAARGLSKAEIARTLRVSNNSVGEWLK